MSVDTFLSKLDHVKRTGPNRWLARCPAHDDHHPSLAIREENDGRLLIHCFSGCSAYEIVSSVGLDLAALFPAREIPYARPERRPFPAADVLRAISYEVLVVSIAAAALLSGQTLTNTDRARLMLASSRLQAALSAAGLNYE